MKTHYDIIIIGGGLAGLTLARQLQLTKQPYRILLIEKYQHPVPEAAFKVGESSVEIGTHYFSKQLQLAAHLKQAQLPKAGLRFFFSHKDNRAIEPRFELGAVDFPPTPSYQLARGRFENYLWDLLRNDANITLRDGCEVKRVELDNTQHSITFHDATATPITVSTDWVIDASGRRGLLKRQLGLAETCPHNCNAVWFRVNGEIDPDDWSTDTSWKNRVPDGIRRLSTNHLMGKGYWVWLIPLATGDTSIGIVADQQCHPFATFNSQAKAQQWLEKFEPQLAGILASDQHQIDDFLALRHYSHSCEKVFGRERWALTGEAGVFLDPFYSPGSDFIALSNTFIVALITAERRGERYQKMATVFNRLYLNLFAGFLDVYQGQYPSMACAEIMPTKIIWDFAYYWAITSFLFFQQKFTDLPFMTQHMVDLQKTQVLNQRVQTHFQQQVMDNPASEKTGFLDILAIDFLAQLNETLPKQYHSDTEISAQLATNIDLLYRLADQITASATMLIV